jgi:hypothetical protein
MARLDPREVRLTLAMDLTREDMRPAWTIDRAPDDAILAVNVAQFASAMPWGWVVVDGRERLAPGAGPLASVVGIDDAGGVHWAHGDTLAPTGIVTGFQSYPTLLSNDGTVPAPLRTVGSLVSLTHRDARLVAPRGIVVDAIGRIRHHRMQAIFRQLLRQLLNIFQKKNVRLLQGYLTAGQMLVLFLPPLPCRGLPIIGAGSQLSSS